jgi:hypothetical protein
VAEERSAVEGRPAHVLSQLYWYAGAVVGVGLLLGGAIAFVLGIRTLVLPREWETLRHGVRAMLHGLAFALPGLLLIWSHLRAAKRTERWAGAPVFWGRSLYFHLVALVALAFVLVGVIGLLHAAIELAVPDCFPGEPPVYRSLGDAEQCYPPPSEVGRTALDLGLVLLVAAPVYWWHLREGRRTVAPGLAAPDETP